MPSQGATLSGLRAYAAASNIDMHELSHPGGGTTVVVPAWGGKIVFVGSGDANTVFTAPDFDDLGDWSWNVGGIRTWLSPEGGPKGTIFSEDFSEFGVPAEMDPGSYVVEPGADASGVRMNNAFELDANDGTHYSLVIGRDIVVGERPDGLDDAVRCCSLDFAHRMKNTSAAETYDKIVDLWHLVQTLPGGVIVAPTKGAPEWRNYFQDIGDDRYAEHDDFLLVRINGTERFKLGIPNTAARNGIGYIMPRGAEAVGIVKRFEIVPGAVHCDKPQIDMVSNGDAVQLYNHMTGGEEAFGEIECHSPSQTLGPGDEMNYPIRIDVLEGPEAVVRAGFGALLDVDVSTVDIDGMGG